VSLDAEHAAGEASAMKHQILAAAAFVALAAFASPQPLNTAQVLERSTAADWRRVAPDNMLYMELASGMVVIELAPQMAPAHVANLRTLVREGFFDGTTINRVQENYVTQWGDPTEKKPVGSARPKLALEVGRPATGLAFTPIPSPDAYAPQVGFVDGFPAAHDPKSGRVWLAHCYGALGVGRGDAVDSGNGTELYTPIGHAPRHLDRNYTVAGRIVQGMEHLTALPRGTADLGFYAKPELRIPIRRVRLGSDVPPAERVELEVMRTDTPSFRAYVDARANRDRDGFLVGAGGVDLCNVRVPVRPAAKR
jgi:peptidylprolyl isomerase